MIIDLVTYWLWYDLIQNCSMFCVFSNLFLLHVCDGKACCRLKVMVRRLGRRKYYFI